MSELMVVFVGFLLYLAIGLIVSLAAGVGANLAGTGEEYDHALALGAMLLWPAVVIFALGHALVHFSTAIADRLPKTHDEAEQEGDAA